MNQEVLNAIQRGHAYCYFHPEDSGAVGKLKNLTDAAWKIGYSVNFCLDKAKDKTVEQMTRWEIFYCLKDIIDISLLD